MNHERQGTGWDPHAPPHEQVGRSQTPKPIGGTVKLAVLDAALAALHSFARGNGFAVDRVRVEVDGDKLALTGTAPDGREFAVAAEFIPERPL